MLIIFLGPPGAGKGTQSKIIASQFGLKHVATGDMLREVARSDTALGEKIAEMMASGSLVTNDLVNEVVTECLTQQEYKKGCIIDGFPRTIEQAYFFEQIYSEDYFVIRFKISVEKLKARIEGRFTCLDCGEIYNENSSPLQKEGECNKCQGSNFEYRADDNEASLLTRINIFEDEISAILHFFDERNKLVVIDADQNVEMVTKQIVEAIKNH